MARKTNLGVPDYVHLTYEGALEDNKLRIKRQIFNATARAKRNQRILEQKFLSEVGVSAQSFAKQARKMEDAFNLLNHMFTCESLSEIEKLISKDELKKLKIGEGALNSIISASKITSYANILGLIYTGKKDNKDFKKFADTFADLDLYNSILEKLQNNDIKNSEEKAALFYLLEEISKESKNFTEISKKANPIIDFNWDDKKINEMQKVISELHNNMDSILCLKDEKAINKFIESARTLINKRVKGVLVGESNSALIMSILAPQLIEGIQTETLKIEHKGNTSRVKETPISYGKDYLGIETDYRDLKIFESVIKNIKTIDKKMDIKVKYQIEGAEKSMNISVKTLKSRASYISLVSQQNSTSTLASLLAFGDMGGDLTNFYLKKPVFATLLNALNFYYLKDDYGIKEEEEEKVMRVVLEGSSGTKKNKGRKTFKRSGPQIDAVFGNILTNLTLDLMVNFLMPQTTSFIYVNNICIPTPIYYKYMTKKLLKEKNSNKYAFTNHLKPSRESYNEYIKNSVLLNTNITDAKKIFYKRGSLNYLTESQRKKKRSKGYYYTTAALKRNQLIKQNILDSKMSIKTDFITRENFKNILRQR